MIKGKDNLYREFYSDAIISEGQTTTTDSGKHCVMVGIDELSEEIVKYGNSIKDSEIYNDETNSFGRENWPHLTVLYGILPISEQQTKKILGKIPNKLTITLGKTSIFECKDFDVLKVEALSPQLTTLNKFLRENVKYECDYDEYVPHLTIAYLKKGCGAKYANDSRFEGRKFVTKEYTYADGTRNKFKITEDTSFSGVGALLGTYTSPGMVQRIGSYDTLGTTIAGNPYNTLHIEDITIGNFNKDSVLCGMRYEMSKMVQPDKHVAKVTVKNNLESDPRYYDDLFQYLNTDRNATDNPLK